MAIQLRIKSKTSPEPKIPAVALKPAPTVAADPSLKPHDIEFLQLEPELLEAIRVLRRLGFEGSDEDLLERAKLEVTMRHSSSQAGGKGGFLTRIFA